MANANDSRMKAYLRGSGKLPPERESEPASHPPRAEKGEKGPALRGRRGASVPEVVKEPEKTAREVKPGLLKTSREGGFKENNYRKVAKFLVLVGKDEAAKILARLDPAQVEKVTREIASIDRIETTEAEALLDEFRSLLSSGLAGIRGIGGVESAREILQSAFGTEKGNALLSKAVPESVENPFAFLEDFDGEQVALLLHDEAPFTMALVLSRISAPCAAKALGALDATHRLEILRRLARLGRTSPEVLEKVAQALREKAHKIGKTTGETVDGRSALAEILKHSDMALGERLLGELEEADPELGRDLKERLYTLDDVLRAEDRPLQEKLRSMEDRDIAVLLKGKSPEFIEKLLSNLSATRRTLVAQERELLGPLPKKDVDEASRDFLGWFRAGRESGKILIADGDELI